MPGVSFSIVVQDVLKVIIMLGGFLYFSWGFYQTIHSYFNPDPRNLFNVNNYILWIALVPLNGLIVFGSQLYIALKKIIATYHK